MEINMFTERTNWNSKSNRVAQKAAALRSSGRKLLDLTQSNPTRCGFRYLDSHMLDPLMRADALVHHPSPKGLTEPREAIAAYYRSQGFEVDPFHICIVAGTSDAYSYLFRMLLEPGESLLVPSPSYPLLDFIARLNDVTLKSYPLHYDDRWWVDIDAIRETADDRTRAIVIINPNNPTGSFVSKGEMRDIVAFARERQIALIVDEVFFDYQLCDETPHSAVMIDSALTFTLNGISKTLGLPQMKLSWVVVGGPADLVATASERLDIIADTYLSASTPIQLALKGWLDHKDDIQSEILGRVRENRSTLQSFDACTTLNIAGGWSAIVRVPSLTGAEDFVLQLMEKDGVLVDPGSFYGFASDNYIVLSLLPASDVFREAAALMDRRIRITTA
jgi:alanine-synthesizing transaminase